MNERLANLSALMAEHCPEPLTGPEFQIVVCDGCFASALPADAIALGWNLGAVDPPDLCRRCVDGAWTLPMRLVVALRVRALVLRGSERAVVLVSKPGRAPDPFPWWSGQRS